MFQTTNQIIFVIIIPSQKPLNCILGCDITMEVAPNTDTRIDVYNIFNVYEYVCMYYDVWCVKCFV